MRRLRAGLAFTVTFRAVLRDPTALFFIVALPVVIIVVIGVTFGGQGEVRVGVASADRGRIASAVVHDLRAADGISVRTYDNVSALRRAVRTATVDGGLVLPGGLDQAVRAGQSTTIHFLAGPGGDAGLGTRQAVTGVVDRAGARFGAAVVVDRTAGGGFEANLHRVEQVAADQPADQVHLDDVGGSATGLSRFSLTAPQNLVLFVFTNALGASAFIVAARRDGVLRRAFASPAGLGVVVLGQGTATLTLSILQSLLIVGIGSLAFGVRWGDPLAAVLLVAAYAAVGSGAGLLLGVAGRDPDRVQAIGPIVGVVLAALGGCMVPLEVFPSFMVTVAHITPQYWAIVAWQDLIFDGSGLGAIAGSLIVLAVVAVVLTVAATTLLSRDLAGRR